MIVLAICSQDIDEIHFLLQTDETIKERQFVSTSPEEQLQALNTFLNEQQIQLKDLTEIFVVTGPGSFTASRISTTIANAMAFSLDIPVTGLINTERKALRDLVIEAATLPKAEKGSFAVPNYDRPANITKPRG